MKKIKILYSNNPNYINIIANTLNELLQELNNKGIITLDSNNTNEVLESTSTNDTNEESSGDK